MLIHPLKLLSLPGVASAHHLDVSSTPGPSWAKADSGALRECVWDVGMGVPEGGWEGCFLYMILPLGLVTQFLFKLCI